jgi:hypothetical protein
LSPPVTSLAAVLVAALVPETACRSAGKLNCGANESPRPEAGGFFSSIEIFESRGRRMCLDGGAIALCSCRQSTGFAFKYGGLMS